MPKKVVPAWGWEPGAPLPGSSPRQSSSKSFEQRLSDVPFSELAAGLGLDEARPGHFRNELTSVLKRYYGNAFSPGAPSSAQIRKALETVREQFAALRWTLDNLDHASRIYLEDALEAVLPLDSDTRDEHELLADGLTFTDAELERYEELAYAFEAAADDARADVPPPRRGRPRDWITAAFVRDLAALYERHAGAPAYDRFAYNDLEERCEGPFMELAEATLRAFAPDKFRSNLALGEIVRATIGGRRKSKAGPPMGKTSRNGDVSPIGGLPVLRRSLRTIKTLVGRYPDEDHDKG